MMIWWGFVKKEREIGPSVDKSNGGGIKSKQVMISRRNRGNQHRLIIQA